MKLKSVVMMITAAALLLIAFYFWPGLHGRVIDLNQAIDGPMTVLRVRPGTLLQYSYHLHESLGYTAEYRISKSKVRIIRLKASRTSYRRPWRMLPGMTGGDEARGTFVFRAEVPGTVVLTIDELFRGDVESTVRYKIKVQ